MPINSEQQRKIEISELPKEIPDFSGSFESKDSLVKKWIINWIKWAVKNNRIKENDILPKKSEISNHLGVSIGTVQNAIRYVEDEGLLKSKQKLGTMISNFTNPQSNLIKSVSKRDKAILAIKKALIQNECEVGKSVPSARKMSELLGLSQNTTRLAYECLTKSGILISRQSRGSDSNWILNQKPSLSSEEFRESENLNSITLVNKITNDIKILLSQNFSVGDKIPSHEQLSQALNVSIKTIHDSIQALCNEGIIITRRGRYGSVLAKNPLSDSYEPLKENSIFAKAQVAELYSYQRTEAKIISMINQKYKAGDKLPSMQQLADMFDVSTNTIRKALTNMEKEGFLAFERGRFGGTYLIDSPQSMERQAYQWLAINPDYK